MNDIHARLSAPFERKDLKFLPGATTKNKDKALAMVYVDARAVQDRLDSVMGWDNWQDNFICYHGSKDKVVCTISLRINGEWLSRSNGAGNTDIEAEKGSFSDAFRRAASKWGVGRYLYNCKGVWVPFDADRKQFSEDAYPHFKSLAVASPGNTKPPVNNASANESKEQPNSGAIKIPPLLPDGSRAWSAYVDALISLINNANGFDGAKAVREANIAGMDMLDRENPELRAKISDAAREKFASMKKPKE